VGGNQRCLAARDTCYGIMSTLVRSQSSIARWITPRRDDLGRAAHCRSVVRSRSTGHELGWPCPLPSAGHHQDQHLGEFNYAHPNYRWCRAGASIPRDSGPLNTDASSADSVRPSSVQTLASKSPHNRRPSRVEGSSPSSPHCFTPESRRRISGHFGTFLWPSSATTWDHV